MDIRINQILDKVSSTPHFVGIELVDVNTTNALGDNALHRVCVWGDVEAAKTLMEAGININRFGDRGYTPLHTACMFGHLALVELLVSKGADLFAQSDGDIPFTAARLGGNDAICNYLSPLMELALSHQRDAYVRSRIEQLKREISRLEATLS